MKIGIRIRPVMEYRHLRYSIVLRSRRLNTELLVLARFILVLITTVGSGSLRDALMGRGHTSFTQPSLIAI